MSHTVKIVKIGNSAGIILPKADLEKLQAEIGDSVIKVNTPNGFELCAPDAEFERQMALARQIM